MGRFIEKHVQAFGGVISEPARGKALQKNSLTTPFAFG